MAKVEQWTEEQQETYKKEFPGVSPKPWVVMDGRLIAGFYNAEEEAKEAAAELNRNDAIAEKFSAWIDEIMDEYKVEYDTVKEIVEAQL